MKTYMLLLVGGIVMGQLQAQTDSTETTSTFSRTQKIKLSRLELKEAFMLEDQVGVSLWLDSLNRLEDPQTISLNWDERWLLYFWQENFGAFLAEAGHFGQSERDLEAWKIAPEQDSLFELVDAGLYEKRFQIFQSIQHAFLSEEEKAFTTLALEYLLRLNTNDEDWDERVVTFSQKYQQSRYNYFLGSTRPNLLKPANKAFGISAKFLSGNWSGQLERSLNPLYAAQIDVYYWVARWNINIDGIFGGPRLARDVTEGIEIWPKNDPTNFIYFGFDIGYDIINNSKVRIFPSVGGAITALKPPTPDEDAGEEYPSYYDAFNLFEGHVYTTLTADAKLFGKNYKDWDVPKGSYHGIRLKIGYNWLNFKGQNKMLAGNLFYLSVGYNLFAFFEAKK